MKILPFKMRVNPEQSAKVQEILFKNGYQWRDLTMNVFLCKWLILRKFKDFGEPKLTYSNNLMDYFYHTEPELTYDQFIKLYDK